MRLSSLNFVLLLGMPSYTLGPPPRYTTTTFKLLSVWSMKEKLILGRRTSFGIDVVIKVRKANPAIYVYYYGEAPSLVDDYHMGPPPPFPFLEGVGYAGVQEFQKIFQNSDLSGFQWNGLLEDWARRNNVTDSFRLFKDNMEREKREGEANLLKCLDELRQFFIDYHRIGNNLVYTGEQANELRQELFRKLTRKQKRLAVRLSNIFTPGDVQWSPDEEGPYIPEPYPRRFGPRRGRSRQRRGPFGRWTMGPFPFQPMDFGQGSYEEEE